MKSRYLFSSLFLFFLFSCNNNKNKFDASGIFEADEVIVSAEVNGRLKSFLVEEGATLSKDSIIGLVDSYTYQLQQEQVEASIEAIGKKNIPIQAQIEILQAQVRSQQEQSSTIGVQLSIANKEKLRIEKLVKGDAAPAKQLDDINNQIELIQQQMKALQSQVSVTQQQIKSQSILLAAQNSGINSEKLPLEKRKELAQDQYNKTKIVNPISGTVLSKYVNTGEIVTMAKPLYKIADLNQLKLKAYISGSQLSKVKLNQEVKIRTDYGEKDTKDYVGKIIWISEKSEFTPKTIQTKDERANLVYAIKILVTNDGYLKLGMYGEVTL